MRFSDGVVAGRRNAHPRYPIAIRADRSARGSAGRADRGDTGRERCEAGSLISLPRLISGILDGI